MFPPESPSMMRAMKSTVTLRATASRAKLTAVPSRLKSSTGGRPQRAGGAARRGGGGARGDGGPAGPVERLHRRDGAAGLLPTEDEDPPVYYGCGVARPRRLDRRGGRPPGGAGGGGGPAGAAGGPAAP